MTSKNNSLNDKFSFTTTPNEESFVKVQEFVDDRLRAADIPKSVGSRIQVVIDEIWSNIVNYATEASYASVVLGRKEDSVYIEFIDDGAMYDPTKAKKPDVTLSAEERCIGGLGIHMVTMLSSSMDYRYDNERNILTVSFNL